MKFSATILLATAMFLPITGGTARAQTGPGTTFFFGTHHYADQIPEPYPFYPSWFIVRAPAPASYYTFTNLLDIHSVQVTRNGSVLTAQGDNPDYGYFVVSDPRPTGGYMVILVFPVPPLPSDRLRVSFDYVQQQ